MTLIKYSSLVYCKLCEVEEKHKINSYITDQSLEQNKTDVKFKSIILFIYI